MPITSYRGSRAHMAAVELYEFIYGDGAGDVFTYTNADRPVEFGGVTYKPIPIAHDNIKSEGRPTGNELKLTVPRTSEIAGHFRGVVPRRIIFVRIYQGEIPREDDSGYLTSTITFTPIYFGRVTEGSPKKHEVEMTCNTAGMGLKRPGLMRNYQRQCAFVLYGERCQASRAAATRAATVAEIAGFTVTLEPAWLGTSPDRADFVGGIFEWSGTYGTEYRMILDCTQDDVVSVDGPLPGLSAGDSVNMILGCNRSMAACSTLHNNIVNFGGMPYIPIVNPINKNNHS